MGSVSAVKNKKQKTKQLQFSSAGWGVLEFTNNPEERVSELKDWAALLGLPFKIKVALKNKI